jgi:phosphatidylglycerophosphate synthase
MKLQPSALRPLIAPLIERPMGALGRMGVNPNVVTTLGFLVTVSAGLSFFLGNIRAGGALVLLGGLLDMVDGAIARAANLSTKFGSFYDSTLDRASEVVVLIGVMSWCSPSPARSWSRTRGPAPRGWGSTARWG